LTKAIFVYKISNYSKFYSVEDILVLVKEYNLENEIPFEISFKNGTISWGRDYEGIEITNDEQLYINAPSWRQFILKN
jgi:hypothetical protein